MNDVSPNLTCHIISLLQSYVFLRVLSKPPLSPPYLLILFYLTEMLVAVIDLYVLFGSENKNFGLVAATLLRLAVPTFLAWLAGTLPLEPILPAKNVATGSDVSYMLLEYILVDAEFVARYPQVRLLCLKIV